MQHLVVTSPSDMERLLRQIIREELAEALDPPKEWVTVSEAARRTGKGVSTIYRWIDQGLIPVRGGDGIRTEVKV